MRHSILGGLLLLFWLMAAAKHRLGDRKSLLWGHRRRRSS